MPRVRQTAQRASLDPSILRRVGPPAGWAGLWPHGDRSISLWIDGTDDGPFERLVRLADVVLAHLDALEGAANAYLRDFVLHGDEYYSGPWRVQSMRMNWWEGSRFVMGDEFKLTLAVREDDYGEWAVRFVRDDYPAKAFRPYSFSRTQR